MVEPILNKCKIAIKRTTRVDATSPKRDQAYGEPHLLKKRSDDILVYGQVSDRQFEERAITRIGDNPETNMYFIFTATDLIAAGLWGNTEPTDDLRNGDIVVSFEEIAGRDRVIDAEIIEVRPESPDYFSGENKFLLIYVYVMQDTERRGTLG